MKNKISLKLGVFLPLLLLFCQNLFADPVQILVHFDSTATPAYIDDIKTQLNAIELDITPVSNVRLWEIDGVEVDGAIFLNDAEEGVIEIEEVIKDAKKKKVVIQEEEIFELPDRQTGLLNCSKNVYGSRMPDYEDDKTEIKVGIIDSGIDASNPWLSPFIAGGWNLLDDNSNLSDMNDHGTHVAGIILQGSHYGGIRLFPYKVVDNTGEGSLFQLIKAIDYAILDEVHIINLSMGYVNEKSDYNGLLKLAIDNAASANILIITSAGNEGINIDTSALGFYPANYDATNLLVVASSNCYDEMSNFSNFGDTSVDFAVLGEYILSMLDGLGFGYKSGTSMSAAIATGFAVWLLDDLGIYGVSYSDLSTALLDNVDANTHTTVTTGVLDPSVALGFDSFLSMPAPGTAEEQVQDMTRVMPTTVKSMINNNGIEYIINSSNELGVKVSLFSMEGQMVHFEMQHCLAGENRFQLSKQVPSGMYILNVRVGNESFTNKIVQH